MACSIRRPEDDKDYQFQILKQLPSFDSSPSYLPEELPRREGERPECEVCLPHAQKTQQSPDEIFAELTHRASSMLESIAKAGRSTVSMPSTFPAFHLICKDCSRMPAEACMTPGGPSCGTEFAHIHTCYYGPDSTKAIEHANEPWQRWQGGGQGSMHMCLTVKDAAKVLESGWGERHLLAGKNASPGFSVPSGLVLVYAPRTKDELEICLKILSASSSFAQST